MKYVDLWEFKNNEWKKLGIKMPLDVNSPIASTWGNSIKIGEVYAFTEGSNPVKHKPCEVPQEILDLISPAQGIREREIRAKKIFEGSSRFFIEATAEVLKPVKLAKSKFIPQEGSSIDQLLKGLEKGLKLEETNFNNQDELVNYLGKLGYLLTLKGDKYYT